MHRARIGSGHGKDDGVTAGIRAVCFDLDGTLLRDDHVDGVIRRVAGELAAEHGIGDGFADEAVHTWQVYWLGVGESALLATIPTDALPAGVWAALLGEHAVASPEQAGTEAFARQCVLEAEGAHLYDESRDVLDAVKARGIRTALITNGPSDLQRAKLDRIGLDDAFDAVIVSSEVGCRKPDAAIFELALEELGVSARESLHIGDNQIADVGGARAAGLTAVWIDRHGVERRSDPHHVVQDLRGLLDLA